MYYWTCTGLMIILRALCNKWYVWCIAELVCGFAGFAALSILLNFIVCHLLTPPTPVPRNHKILESFFHFFNHHLVELEFWNSGKFTELESICELSRWIDEKMKRYTSLDRLGIYANCRAQSSKLVAANLTHVWALFRYRLHATQIFKYLFLFWPQISKGYG